MRTFIGIGAIIKMDLETRAKSFGWVRKCTVFEMVRHHLILKSRRFLQIKTFIRAITVDNA